MSKQAQMQSLNVVRASAYNYELQWQDGNLFTERLYREEAECVANRFNAYDTLLTVLTKIEAELDAAMGEWACVEPPYLPPSHTDLYDCRQIARDAITNTRPQQAEA